MSKQSIFDMAYRGQTSDIKRLLGENSKLVTSKDDNERMLIHWAALGGHGDIVRFLLSLDSPVDPTDDMDMTPLILAASAGREKIVEILLAEGADPNAKTRDEHSALQYAASKNWKSICAALLKKDAYINISDKLGATPLHRAASKGNIAIVNFLLEFGDLLDIDRVDADGNSALHLACQENRREEAKRLVESGANISLKNKEKKTPLDLASPILANQLKEIYSHLETLEKTKT